MQKKLFSALWPLLLLLFLAAGATRAESENALLWRLETPQGAVSYLFGTIHSEDPRVLELPDPVKRAFGTAQTLVLEMDLGRDEAAEMGRAMLLPAGQDLQSLIGADLYQQSVSAMAERGYAEAVVSRLQPWAVVLTLSMPPAETGLFLDYVLYLQALEQGMTVFGLEQMHEQLGVFTSLSLDEQLSLLRDTLSEHDEFPRIFEKLLQAYLQRDLQSLAELGEESMQGSDKGLQQRFMGALLDERNQLMVRRLLPLLEKGEVFAAVGALHLPGEQGLLAMLRRQGLRITPVY